MTGRPADRLRAHVADRAAPPAAPATPPPAAEEETVRRTVDLPLSVNAALDGFLVDAATRAGRRRVLSQDALLTLVRVLVDDPAVQARVIADLPAPRARRPRSLRSPD